MAELGQEGAMINSRD